MIWRGSGWTLVGLVFHAAAHAESTTWTPLVLNTTYFGATASTVRTNSSWGTAHTAAPAPLSTRSLTFWGAFKESCALVWGFNVERQLPHTSAVAFYPQCDPAATGARYGPSVEADIVLPSTATAAATTPTGVAALPLPSSKDDGASTHFIRTVAGVDGPFIPYTAAGQAPSGANKHIAATYVDFNPAYLSTVLNRMKPWGAVHTNNTRLRMCVRVQQAVSTAIIPEPSISQLQQVATVTIINEQCNEQTSVRCSLLNRILHSQHTCDRIARLSGCPPPPPDNCHHEFRPNTEGFLLPDLL
jgi:hypothetical protein